MSSKESPTSEEGLGTCSAVFGDLSSLPPNVIVDLVAQLTPKALIALRLTCSSLRDAVDASGRLTRLVVAADSLPALDAQAAWACLQSMPRPYITQLVLKLGRTMEPTSDATSAAWPMLNQAGLSPPSIRLDAQAEALTRFAASLSVPALQELHLELMGNSVHLAILRPTLEALANCGAKCLSHVQLQAEVNDKEGMFSLLPAVQALSSASPGIHSLHLQNVSADGADLQAALGNSLTRLVMIDVGSCGTTFSNHCELSCLHELDLRRVNLLNSSCPGEFPLLQRLYFHPYSFGARSNHSFRQHLPCSLQHLTIIDPNSTMSPRLPDSPLPQLQYLDMQRINVDAAELSKLAQMTALTSLTVASISVPLVAAAAQLPLPLPPVLRHLKVLVLGALALSRSVGMPQLQQLCPQLESLTIGHFACTSGLASETAAHVFGGDGGEALPHLRELCIPAALLCPEAGYTFACTTALTLRNCQGLCTPQFVQALQRLTAITVLHLVEGHNSNLVRTALQHLPSLRALSVYPSLEWVLGSGVAATLPLKADGSFRLRLLQVRCRPGSMLWADQMEPIAEAIEQRLAATIELDAGGWPAERAGDVAHLRVARTMVETRLYHGVQVLLNGFPEGVLEQDSSLWNPDLLGKDLI